MTVKSLTAQQLLDNALFGIRKQGYKRSERRTSVDVVDGVNCAYRGRGGLKCGIGHSIPDEHYDPKMDSGGLGGGIGRVCRHFATVRELIGDHGALARALQLTHDNYLGPDGDPLRAKSFEDRMREIATEFGLTYTPV